MKTYCGELMNGETWIGCIHRVENGYIVRKPDGKSIGHVLFNGRVFSGTDFDKIGSTDLGYATERRFKLKNLVV